MEHFEAILEALGAKWRLLFVTIEQGALANRRGRMPALGRRGRCGSAAAATALGDQARPCPLGVSAEWLMDAIEETCPLEDRVPERKVFQGITEAPLVSGDDEGVPATRRCRTTTRMICVIAGSRSGISRASLRASSRSGQGTRKPSMSLDVYSHVMPAGRDRVRAQFLALIDA